MLLTIALVLLAAWGAAALLPHGFGDGVHVLLLIGLMLLLLAILKGRDEALHSSGRRDNRRPDGDRRR